MNKTLEDYQRENEALKDQLRETTRILKIIYYAWQRSRWHFPKVSGQRMSDAVQAGESLAGEA